MRKVCAAFRCTDLFFGDPAFLRFICGKSVKKNEQILEEYEKISTYSRQLVGFIVQIRCWNNVLSYISPSFVNFCKVFIPSFSAFNWGSTSEMSPPSIPYSHKSERYTAT